MTFLVDPIIEGSYRPRKALGKNKSFFVIPDICDFNLETTYRAVRDMSIKNSGAVVIVMSVDDKSSQGAAKDFADLFKELNKNPNNIILVLNKIDCEDKLIRRLEGIKLAKEIGCSYIETSAKTRENIDEMFEEAIKLCLVYKEKGKPGKSKSNCVCQ